MEEDQTIEYDETESLSLFANALSSPLPTASSNGKILEEAGLIRTSCQSGKRGFIKRCSIRSERVSVEFFKSAQRAFFVDTRSTCPSADLSISRSLRRAKPQTNTGSPKKTTGIGPEVFGRRLCQRGQS